MSKSRNSKNYQAAHGEDLEYEIKMFGDRSKEFFVKPKIKRIEDRRIQRQVKHQFLEIK